MRKSVSIYFLLFSLIAFSQSEKLVGKDLMNNSRLKFLKGKSDLSKIIYSKQNNQEVLVFETLDQPKFIYNYAAKLPIHQERQDKNTVFLLSFDAKTTSSSEETGEAKVFIQLKQSASFKDNLGRTLNLGSSWKRYFVSFQSTKSISKQDLGLVLQYGFQPQAFVVKNISFQVFEKGTSLSDLPKTKISYMGMEIDAEWRIQANKRIEAIRKGNFTIKLSKNGKPISNKEIKISLKEHAFPFGAMMHARDIVNDKVQYKNFKDLFNLTVLGNDLKIKGWANQRKRPITLKALEQLEKDKITTKGHVLMWPGFQYNTKEVRENKDNPEKVKEIVINHINSILEGTKGKVSHWDVVNETYTNRDFQKIMGGEDFLYEAFEIAKKKAPYAKRFTNEYGIISKGGIDTKKQKWYYDYIKRVDKNTGNAIQGIGIQSHIGSDLTPPEKVIEILGFYATLGKQISISEFTMDIKDHEVREQYTRDFMIAAFSHPNVSEFMFWGFKEDKKGKVDIYTKDNEIGAMGKAYISLVFKDWKTTLTEKTNTSGIFNSKGFYGLYKYSFINEGKKVEGTFQVKPRSKNVIKINLD